MAPIVMRPLSSHQQAMSRRTACARRERRWMKGVTLFMRKSVIRSFCARRPMTRPILRALEGWRL